MSEPPSDPASGVDPFARPPWAVLRARLETSGFRPSRRLGQNFLRDENLLRAIVRDAGVVEGDCVLEVGPGCGFLTLELARITTDLVCVEIDARLLAIARELCAGCPSIRWIEGDVLASKHALEPRVEAELPRDRPWKLVSNLPYSVSAPLLAVLSVLDRPPASMTVLVQKEVAERIVAHPGSSDWGPLSIRLQRDHDVRTTRHVPPQLFWPRPQVESSVVHLERRPGTLDLRRGRAFDALVDAIFTRRRQALGRVLGEAVGRERGGEVLGELGIDPRRRGEELDLATLERMARALAAGGTWPPPANTRPDPERSERERSGREQRGREESELADEG